MQDKFYNTLKVLLFTIIILNVIDSITTMIGVFALSGVEEGNPILALFTNNLTTFVLIKVLMLSAMFIGALLYLFKVHHSFPKLWENEVSVTAISLVCAFYLFVIVNNFVIIFSV